MIQPEEDAPSALYLQCAERAASLDPERSPEAILQLVKVAARIAADSHCFRFADGLIENQALAVARALPDRALPANLVVGSTALRSRPSKVLHVASCVFEVGGHSRMIAEWISRDVSATHCLVTTHQECAPPPSLMKAVTDSGGRAWVLGYHSPLAVRAQWLRALAACDFDFVILHVAPDDPIPVAAFGVPGGPPVALVNHADHIFWLGSSVTDVLINLRPVGAQLSAARRFPNRSCTIPIPVSQANAPPDRADARVQLGIPDAQEVLVSIGRAMKFTPSGTHDFYRVARRLLSEHPAAHIYLLGPDDVHYRAAAHTDVVPDRLHLLGPVTNPLTWLAAADVYLESFPFGSQTATLEAATMGPSVVLALAPPIPLLVASDMAFDGLIDNATTEDDYCRRVSEGLDPLLSSDAATRLSTAVRTHHVGEHWLVWLRQVYDSLRLLPHMPRDLPIAATEMTETDRAISAWLRSTNGGSQAARSADYLLHATQFVRDAGECTAAFQLLRLSSQMSGLNVSQLTALVKIAGRAVLGDSGNYRAPSANNDLNLDFRPQSAEPGDRAAAEKLPALKDRRDATALTVCIVQPDVSAVSETFLQSQAERLPLAVKVLHGFPPSVDGRPIWSHSLTARAARKGWRLLTRKSHQDEVTAAYSHAFRLLHPAVVLAQYGPSGVAVQDACRLLNIPLVVHFHGYDASQHDVLEENRVTYPQLFESAAAIVVVSDPMAAQLVALGADPAKIRHSPYGIDCDLFKGADPGLAPPVLLSVGRFVEKKAPLSTIQAFVSAVADVPAARLRMIGDGPLLQSCRELVERLGLSQSVDFLGSQPPAVVRQEMQRARAFVQHSVVAESGDSEGMPVSILEAGASGLAVISTRHAGIPEAVLHNDTGILVAEHDVAGMGLAMSRLLRDPLLAARLGRHARDHVRRNFSIDDSIRRLSGILHEAAHVPAKTAALRVACLEPV